MLSVGTERKIRARLDSFHLLFSRTRCSAAPIRRALRVALLSLQIAAVIRAQGGFTEIKGSLTNSDGSVFVGTLQISLHPGPTSQAPLKSDPITTITRNGLIDILLPPTTLLSQGTVYSATYLSDNGTAVKSEDWQVPVSDTPLTPSSIVVRTTGSPSVPGDVTGKVLPIRISDVLGLSADLSSMNSSIATESSGVAALQTTLPMVNGQVASLTANLSTLNGQAAGQLSSISALTATVTALSSQVAAVLSQLNTVQSQADKLNLRVTNLEQSISGLKSLVASGGQEFQFVDYETPKGVLDGANTTFTLEQAPAPQESLAVYKNGVLLKRDLDYTINGPKITFADLSRAPQSTDTLLASYRY